MNLTVRTSEESRGGATPSSLPVCAPPTGDTLSLMSKHENSTEPRIGRFDRFLAYTALILAAASIISFFAIIIGTSTGMSQESFGVGIWPFVAALPLFGLPLAFAMIIALLVISFVRKGRADKKP